MILPLCPAQLMKIADPSIAYLYRYVLGSLPVLVAGPLGLIAAMGIAVVIATRMPMAEQTRLILAGLIVPTLWAIGIGWMVCQRRLGRIGLTMLPAPNRPLKKRSDRCQRANAPGSMR
jgi:hypothetical protein